MTRRFEGRGRWAVRALVPGLIALVVAAGCQRLADISDSATERLATENPAGEPFPYAEATIAGLAERMRTGELTSRMLTQAYLDRIAAVDDAGPTLNAVIEVNPQALAEADALDAERKAGRVRGPLHGIPILVKDNIDATPMVNSAGSLALAGHRPTRDAFVVERLRRAGAVILGKTNLSEWANFRSVHSTSGWSGRGGLTRNPYVLDRSACGSSSGTGAAIAANLAVAGIGTETDGSILCPASVSGLVGVKPTVGLVSRSGIIPISRSQDTAGPMTRSVADAAVLLSVMAGRDDEDRATAESVGRAVFDYPRHLDADGLRGSRIGVLRERMGKHAGVDAAMERAIAALRAAGATVVDARIPTEGQWDAPELEVLLWEFRPGVEHYLASRSAPVRTLAGIAEFNRRNAGAELSHFGQDLFERAMAMTPLDDPEYFATRNAARRLAGPEGIDAALREQRLDALVAPTMSPAWKADLVNGDPSSVSAGYGGAAVAGYPSITVPMGESQGLPLGIVFMGTAWSEPRLIRLAHAYEQASRARKPPRFLATLPSARAEGSASR